VVYAFEGVFKDSAKSITILKIESIFNSPLTVLVPLLFLDLVVLQPGALFEPLRYATSFWLMVAAGVGTGIIGLAVSRLMKGMLKQYSPLLLFAIALVTYALTENVGGSGMLAVAVCGLIAGNFGVPKKEKEEIERFEDHLSEMLRISVFTLLGAQIAFTLTMHEFLVACVFFVAVFLLRPVWALPLLGKRLRSEMTRRDVLVLSFLAPRGLASAAMAPIVAAVIISAGSPVMGGFILNVIFLIILLSILLSTIAAILLREKIEAPVERLKVLPEEKLVEYEELGKKKAKPAKPKKKKPKKK
ncbi:MAG: cation:proton antiporter, partial [Candidatus Aenigmatarchaeota archaeon]